MIIFYNKNTHHITGIISGRLHSKHVLEKTWVGNPEETSKFIVPFIRENPSSDNFIPNVSFASKINEFESGVENAHKHKVILGEGSVIDIITIEV
ncbi:MAG: hypothetical protein ACTSQE_07375 [Candidatus Heimdallarchaeaceae archaeon]